MSRDELLAALLAERYGPLPVERTKPIPKTLPKQPKTTKAVSNA